MSSIIGFLKKTNRKYTLYHFRKHPLLWMRAACLTWRYVDVYEKFPAILFNGPLKLKIRKQKGARVEIKTQLIIEPWIKGETPTIITLAENARLLIDGEFTFGDGIRVSIAAGGTLVLKGRKESSGCGITANAVVLVNKSVEIGADCIIAWDTFITDSDWHTIEGKESVKPTIVGDHVWLGVGSKILKGVQIGRDSIVAANSVVLQNNYPERTLISGSPAQVVKNDIGAWSR